MLLLRSCYNHTTFSSRSGHDLTMPIELLIRQYYDCNKVFLRFHHYYTMQKLLPRSYMYHNLSTFPLRFIENHILLINRCSPFTRLLETSIPWQKKNTYHQNRQKVVHCGRGRSRGMGHHLITLWRSSFMSSWAFCRVGYCILIKFSGPCIIVDI